MKYLMATGNHHYAALDIVEKDAPFDDWQEENAAGHVADVDSRWGHCSSFAFHQVHNTTV